MSSPDVKELPEKLTTMSVVYSVLKADESKIQAVLPKAMNVTRFMRGAVDCVLKSKNAAMLSCTTRSFTTAVIDAASLGLCLDGVLGEAYLVPFAGRVSLMPSYKGLLKLVRQSPEVAMVTAKPVYKVDDFDFGFGSKPFIDHRPRVETEDDLKIENLRYVYFMVKLTNGCDCPFVMPIAEVWQHRDKFAKEYNSNVANNKKDSFWHKHPVPMSIKTVVKQGCNSGQLPISLEVAALAAMDDKIEREWSGDLGSDLPPASEAARHASDSLSDRLEAEQQAKSRPAPPQKSRDADRSQSRQPVAASAANPDEAPW